ncbi:MAG: serine/threonine protein kinase [Alphaproteobacteria bacterium]|nr:serine/threonine protein kinase [Alphaproteobacteria bacterium]
MTPRASDDHPPVFGGRFRLVQRLGRGQAGDVFEAEDLRLGGRAAVKVLSPEHGGTPVEERFVQEARVLARLDHPHVVRLVGGLEAHDGLRYFAVELAEHGSLDTAIGPGGALALDQALRFARQILGALVHVHALGLIHRDVKPSNVLVFGGPCAKLADFGVVHDARRAITMFGDELGTPAFMPPEQAIDPADVSPSADVYGMGTTLFTMVTGDKPVVISTAGYRERALEALPVGLREVVDRATRPFVEERYATAAHMLEAVVALEATAVTK